MPRFIPVPKLAVAPVSEPSEPILIGAPPAPCEANSEQDTAPLVAAPAAAGALAAAAVVGFGAAVGAAGAAVGCAVGAAVEQAASVSAKALRTTTRAERASEAGMIPVLPPLPLPGGRFLRVTVSHPGRACAHLFSGVIDVDGLHLCEKIDRFAALLVRADARGFDATEGQVHLAAQGGLVHVGHADVDLVDELEDSAHVVGVDRRRQSVLDRVGRFERRRRIGYADQRQPRPKDLFAR